jgi:hypothetical protein
MRKAKAALVACERRDVSSETPWETWVSTSPVPVEVSAGGDPTNGANGDAGSLRERVERLAYSYWEQRGRQHGSADEDWYRAEAEILGQIEQDSEDALEERSRPKLVPISD